MQSKIKTSVTFKDRSKPTVGLECDGVFVANSTVCERKKGLGYWVLVICSEEATVFKTLGKELSASVKTGARPFNVPLVATRIGNGKGKAARNFFFAIDENPSRFTGEGKEDKLKFVKRLSIVSQVVQSSAMQVEEGDGDSAED